MDKHGFCGMCGGFHDIYHISEFDQETRIKVQIMTGLTDAWAVYCEECDNLGFVKEEEA